MVLPPGEDPVEWESFGDEFVKAQEAPRERDRPHRRIRDRWLKRRSTRARRKRGFRRGLSLIPGLGIQQSLPLTC